MAANALVDVRFTLNIAEGTIDRIVGRPDDGSDAWRDDAFSALETYFGDGGFTDHLDQMTNALPEVEVDLA